jgi:hypothetical protein
VPVHGGLQENATGDEEMKLVVAAMLFAVLAAVSCVAQEAIGPVPEACGPQATSMAVDLNRSQHKVVPPEEGTALVYFIQDAGAPEFTQDAGASATWVYPITKIGIDGRWVGAIKKNSYFAVAVEPGEHHICAEVQSSFVRRDIELAHLTAEAGKTYYYRTRLLVTRDGLENLGLSPADRDEARYLIDSYPLAIAHLRK